MRRHGRQVYLSVLPATGVPCRDIIFALYNDIGMYGVTPIPDPNLLDLRREYLHMMWVFIRDSFDPSRHSTSSITTSQNISAPSVKIVQSMHPKLVKTQIQSKNSQFAFLFRFPRYAATQNAVPFDNEADRLYIHVPRRFQCFPNGIVPRLSAIVNVFRMRDRSV